MQLDKIICLANRGVRLQFLAMERSLRATGCRLPLWVIPYDDQLFDLPAGARWWSMPDVLGWLADVGAHPLLRKYQCLTEGGYHFTDTDVVFLRNPETVLTPYSGLVTSCTEWNKPEHTHTFKSRLLMSDASSTWQKSVFNSGQFACDRPLFASLAELASTASRREFRRTCLRFPADQPGLNLLAFHSGIHVTNLTLPPICMESTWAGDYTGEYEPLWTDPERKPLLIHWAGSVLERPLPIHRLFYEHLTGDEKAEWDRHIEQARELRRRRSRWPATVRLIDRGLRWWYRRYRVFRIW